MILVFIRHGKAETAQGKPDELREFTLEGRRVIRCLTKLIPVKPSRIFTSPLKRAVQTAEILAEELGGNVIPAEELRPEKFSLESLKALSPSEGDFFVCHAPSVEKVISELIGGGSVKMRSGAAAGIELEDVSPGSGVLRFLVPPEVSERI